MTKRLPNGETEFRFVRPSAGQVFVLGDFNDWQHPGVPMTPSGNGEWTCRLKLPDGIYEFQYFADGHWYLDYAAFGITRSAFGHNSVLLVEGEVEPEESELETVGVYSVES